MPEDRELLRQVAPLPVDELILELRGPAFATREGVRRARATATLVYRYTDPSRDPITSQRYIVTASLGPIELEEIHWYLED